MNNKTVYIIGSLSNLETIEYIATQLSFFTGYSVKHVQREPGRDLQTLIDKCYEQIEKSFVVVAVPKKNGEMGDGTLYEITYAKRHNVPVIVTDGEDIPKLIKELDDINDPEYYKYIG